MKTHGAACVGMLILSLILTGCDSMPQSQPGGVPGSSGTSLSSIAPPSVAVGSPDLTVTVIGAHFAGNPHYYSQAVWSDNGSNTLLATTFVSSTQLSAVIPAALLNSFVTAQVFVQTGDPMGDVGLLKSNAVSFSVTQPWLTISPTSAAAGSPDLSLTLLGQRFTSAVHKINRVVWSANGTVTTLSATFVSGTQLNAVVPAGLLSTSGNAQVWVEIWDMQGDVPDFTSNSENFTVSP
jgi:hypothetical protein